MGVFGFLVQFVFEDEETISDDAEDGAENQADHPAGDQAHAQCLKSENSDVA